MEGPIEDLGELASAMRDGLSPCIKDRTQRLRTYKRCFPGSEGVRWLIQAGHAADETAAVALGNAMLQAGLLHHVAYENTFKFGDLLYKFTVDDEAGHMQELSQIALQNTLSGALSGAVTPGAMPGTPRSSSSGDKGMLRSVRSVPNNAVPHHGHGHGHGHHHHSSGGGGGGHHAHRALLNAQVHGLNQKLERLAAQHAALVACNAAQQEAWEGQASGDLRALREAMTRLEGTSAPAQQQMLHLTTQVAQLQAALASQRALSTMQQAIMAMAVVALGTDWAPTALWALGAAALGSLLAALIAWRAETSAAARFAAREHAAASRAAERLSSLQAGGGVAAAGSMDGFGHGSPRKAGDMGPMRVLASASASDKSDEAADAPPPMSAEADALRARTVFGDKGIDDTVPDLADFKNWPDGNVMMRPSPLSGDMAVTRLERYESPVHFATPTPAHAHWEARQRKWAATAAEADADDAEAAKAAAEAAANGGGWVPSPAAGVPVNHYLINFESDLFVGKMLVYIRGLPSSHEPYFEGKKRRSVLMIQGRFKQPLWVTDVVTGQEFWRPYKNLRNCWLMEKIVLTCAKRVVSAMETGDMTTNPFITFPLMALAHVINVAPPGAEPPIDQATEDMRLWDASLTDKSGNPLASESRRRVFMGEKARRGRRFTTEHVWTFYIWQQVIDVAGLFLDLMFQNYDMVQHMDGMPLQSMIKDKATGKYLFNFVYWNSKQIEETARMRAEEAAAAAGQAA